MGVKWDVGSIHLQQERFVSRVRLQQILVRFDEQFHPEPEMYAVRRLVLRASSNKCLLNKS